MKKKQFKKLFKKNIYNKKYIKKNQIKIKNKKMSKISFYSS